MRRRRFLGATALGVFGAATCSLWKREPASPLDLVTLSTSQSSEYVGAETQTELWAVLEVGVESAPDFERPAVHVGLVIDSSASMSGDPIAAARAAAAELIESLVDGDRLTVVIFHSHAELVVPNVRIDDDSRELALEQVASIEAQGTTDLGAGLQTVIADLSPHAGHGRVTRVVLLSDGIPNDPGMVSAAIGQAASIGATVTTLGFGLDYDEALLGTIARQTGGTFHFLEQPEELVPLFREENLRLSGIVAQELSLSLTTGPNVDLVEVVGQSLALPQPRVDLGLGDLSRGEERTVVVRLRVGDHRDGATVELLDGQLRYRDPLTGAYVEKSAFLSARAEADEAYLAQAIDRETEVEIENAKAAAATLSAVAMARQGRGKSAQALLQSAAPKAAEIAGRLDDSRLRDQVEFMNDLASELEDSPEEDSEPESMPEMTAAGEGVGTNRPRHARGLSNPMDSPKAERTLRRAHGNAMSNLQTRSSGVVK